MVIACAIIAYALFALPKPDVSLYSTIVDHTINLRHIVSADGMITAGTEVDLGFQQSGQISAINVAVGDSVKKGEILAELNQNSLNVQLEAAQAALAGAKANWADNNTSVTIGYTNAERNAVAAVADAYTKAVNAVENDSDTFFSNPQSLGNPGLLISTQTQGQEIQIETGDVMSHKALNAWAAELKTASSTSAEALVSDAKNYIATITGFMNNLSLAVTAFAQLAPSSVQATVTGDLATMNAATTLLTAATAEITATNNTLLTTTPQNTDALQAKIAQAQASVAAVQTEIVQNDIVAPVDGVITAQTGNVGEAISAAVPSPIIHLISNTPYQVDAYVSESDVATIAVGQEANVTLPAYGSAVIFPATVISVDQSQTVISGAGMYKATLQFDQADSRIRDGMSATAHIVVGENDDVLAVPESAVLNDNGASSVLVLAAGVVKKTPITTGARGVDASGMSTWVEVTGGLSVNQEVITFGQTQ